MTVTSSTLRCPFCLSNVGENTSISCPDCGALHHLDCFAEADGCCVIGCDGHRPTDAAESQLPDWLSAQPTATATELDRLNPPSITSRSADLLPLRMPADNSPSTPAGAADTSVPNYAPPGPGTAAPDVLPIPSQVVADPSGAETGGQRSSKRVGVISALVGALMAGSIAYGVAYQQGQTAADVARKEGYSKGQADGYSEGSTEGYSAGQTAGYSTGYGAGRLAGYSAGWSAGYSAASPYF